MANKNHKSQKMTEEQKQAKLKAAQERQRRMDAKKAAQERTKKIFTWVVVIILVIGLTLPVAGLSAYSCTNTDAANTSNEQVENAVTNDEAIANTEGTEVTVDGDTTEVQVGDATDADEDANTSDSDEAADNESADNSNGDSNDAEDK